MKSEMSFSPRTPEECGIGLEFPGYPQGVLAQPAEEEATVEEVHADTFREMRECMEVVLH